MPKPEVDPEQDFPVVFPYPQKIKFPGGTFRLPKTVGLACEPEDSGIAAMLERTCGVPARTGKGPARINVFLGQDARKRLKEAGLKAPGTCWSDEGYALEVTEKRIDVFAADRRGVFHAFRTLSQLEVLDGRKTRRIACASVRDWPRFRVRGVHVFLPAREDLPFFKRFIEFLGRYKFNTMFLEIGGGMEYDRHPEINRGWERLAAEAAGFPASQSRMQDSYPGHKNSIHIELAGGTCLTKDEVREIIAACREEEIEIVPEVQSLSHSYYLLAAHPEFAELRDERYPDTYCPSNAKVYDLVFDVMEEVIDVFDPRMMSIGHDEVYHLGICPRCRGRDPADLLANDINKIHAFLADRGIRTAMWSEKLHHDPGAGHERWRLRRFGRDFRPAHPNTTRAIDLVPKDLVLLNWYNSVDPASIPMLAKRGFEQVLGNYNAFFYVGNLAEKTGPSLDSLVKSDANAGTSDRAEMLGAEVSTWCAPKADNYRPWLFLSNQLSLWTKEMTPRLVDRMNADLVEVLRRESHFLEGTSSVLATPGKKSFKSVSIEDVADTVCDGEGRMWGGFGNMDLTSIPAGEVTLAGVPFRVLDFPKTRQCPFIGVDANMRGSFPVKVGLKARALAFLHTSCVRVRRMSPWTSHYLGRPVVAAYVIRFGDDKIVEYPVIHDLNISKHLNRWGEPPRKADLAWHGRNRAGDRIALYCSEWINPRPDAEIEEITLIWKGGWLEGDVVCAAMTAVQ